MNRAARLVAVLLAASFVWLLAGGAGVVAQPYPAELRLPDNVVYEPDIEFAQVDGHRLLLDLVRPKQPRRRPLPLVVYIHGGGWMSGDKVHAWQRGYAALAGSGDYAVASINYRLSRVAPWPACLHDSKAAIRWLKANAARYELDAERIAVWGHSAGGHLVALLATTAEVKELEGTLGNLEQSSRVTCGIDEAGPTDFAAYMDFRRPPDGLRSPSEEGSPEYRLFAGPLDERGQQMRAASATTYASRTSAPLLIVHGSEDTVVPINQAELLDEALRRAGADVVYLRLNGAGHSVGHPEYSARRALFLEKHLLARDVEVSGGVVEARSGPATVVARDTALGRLAAGMAPGSWAVLETSGWRPELYGPEPTILAEADSAVWEPRSQQLLFLGQTGGQAPRLIAYAAADNAWRTLAQPSWWRDGGGPAGAYDHNAIDQQAGLTYFHTPATGEVHYHRVGTDQWRRLPALPAAGTDRHASALVYSPDMNGLVRVLGGAVHHLKRGWSQWQPLKEDLALGPDHNVAEYNPVGRWIVLGGGQGSNALYRLDAAGEFTPLVGPPLDEVSSRATVLAVDPVGGDLLLVDKQSGGLLVYSAGDERWTVGTAPPATLEWPARAVAAAAAGTYGVVVFVRDGEVLVYKHAEARRR